MKPIQLLTLLTILALSLAGMAKLHMDAVSASYKNGVQAERDRIRLRTEALRAQLEAADTSKGDTDADMLWVLEHLDGLGLQPFSADAAAD